MKRAWILSLAGFTLAVAGFSQTSNTWWEQWHNAKTGRFSPLEEARLKADRENTAFREETRTQPASSTESEELLKAKTGRYSPMEEARLSAGQSSTTYREQPAPANNSVEQRHKAKYGR